VTALPRTGGVPMWLVGLGLAASLLGGGTLLASKAHRRTTA
jgi:LPXTG-motif cell wall-anchored protein